MSGLSKTPSEDKDKKPSAENFELGRDNVVAQSIVDVSKISCLCSISKPTSPCSVDNLDVGGSQPTDEGIRSQCEENDALNEQFDTSVRVNDECELGDDNLDSIKFESTDCLTYPESQESRTSGLERCRNKG